MIGPCLCGDPECWSCGSGPTPPHLERIGVALDDVGGEDGIDAATYDAVVALVEAEVVRERARCAAIVRSLVGERRGIRTPAGARVVPIGLRQAIEVAVERIEQR